jgi:phage shock protein A
MSEAIIVALLGFAGTLLGSLFGILAAQKLTQYRLVQVEEKSKSNKERIQKLETNTTRLEGRVTEAEHNIEDLKKYHTPIITN